LSSSALAATFSKVKTRERELARRIRREEGAAINDIARRLGVSKSSVSLWVRDIELTPEQRQALLEKNPAYNRQHSGWTKVAERRRAEREACQAKGRALARQRDPGFVAGCMLYWAEGTKDRNQIQFVNSDVAMARFFVDFLKRHFELEAAAIKITCRLYADHLAQQRQVEQHWLDALGLPAESLRKSVVNVYSKYSQRKRVGNLPYGTCTVVVSKTWVAQTIYGAIQEIGGFSRDSWLE
jgi:transcriptional regulator with XRE-family HTH domain